MDDKYYTIAIRSKRTNRIIKNAYLLLDVEDVSDMKNNDYYMLDGKKYGKKYYETIIKESMSSN